MEREKFDALETLSDLDAGVFSQKLSSALSAAALGTVTHGGKGKVVIQLELERIGESTQVKVSHKLQYIKPTLRGKVMEEDTTETPMYVDGRGALSFMPVNQGDLFKQED